MDIDTGTNMTHMSILEKLGPSWCGVMRKSRRTIFLCHNSNVVDCEWWVNVKVTDNLPHMIVVEKSVLKVVVIELHGDDILF